MSRMVGVKRMHATEQQQQAVTPVAYSLAVPATFITPHRQQPRERKTQSRFSSSSSLYPFPLNPGYSR